MNRSVTALALLVFALGIPASTAAAKRPDACTNGAAKTTLRTSGKQLQKLRSGQYYAFRFGGGSWTICDTKAGPARRFKSFNFDLDGQRNTGVRLLSRPGRCVALELRPGKGGYPSVPTVDMRSVPNAGVGSSVNQIDFAAPGATIVRTALSSTCLLGVAYRAAAGARKILLSPILPPNVRQQTITLGEQATDADLRSLGLKGDTVTWKDAGAGKSLSYSGLPPS